MAKQSLNISKGYFEVVNLHLPLPLKKKKDDRQKDRNYSLFILLHNKIKNEKQKTSLQSGVNSGALEG
jgi:hypothetical protein